MDLQGPDQKSLSTFFNYRTAHKRSLKILSKDPRYKDLLKAHREVKTHLGLLEAERHLLWHQISQMRNKALQESLADLERKE